jgi:hypothetical protein
MTFIPNPSTQSNHIAEMLRLVPEKMDLLTVYRRDDFDNPIIYIDDKHLLKEWSAILQSCQEFKPNHPH